MPRLLQFLEARMVVTVLTVKTVNRAAMALASMLSLSMYLFATLCKLLLLSFLFLLCLLALSVDTLIATAIFASRYLMVRLKHWALLSAATALTSIQRL